MAEQEARDVIVISDPENALGRIISMVLKKSRGDRVELLDNPHAALERSQSTPPDLYVMAWWYVGSMTAHEFCRALREMPMGHEVPVLVTSGQSSDHFYDALREAGANAHVSTPAKPDDYLQARDAVLRGEKYGL